MIPSTRLARQDEARLKRKRMVNANVAVGNVIRCFDFCSDGNARGNPCRQRTKQLEKEILRHCETKSSIQVARFPSFSINGLICLFIHIHTIAQYTRLCPNICQEEAKNKKTQEITIYSPLLILHCNSYWSYHYRTP